jgi:hypothetical protein
MVSLSFYAILTGDNMLRPTELRNQCAYSFRVTLPANCLKKITSAARIAYLEWRYLEGEM